MAERVVDVVVGDIETGRLWSHRRGRTESQTFRYLPSYLERPDAYALDPALPLAEGPLQTPAARALFGAFSDSAPDRWGRVLIARRERQRARDAGVAQSDLGEADLLLGVRDDLRQGAVRFREGGHFLVDDESGVPALLDLGDLLSAAERLERDEETAEQLALLLEGGSSLGGVRPKAHVLSTTGELSIAKFPSPANDRWDVIRWEATTLRLARDGGIDAAVADLQVIDSKPVLIVRRFDRTGARRIGYASAMTMLEATEGAQRSYLEIAEVIADNSPTAERDLHELWRRVAFGILASNFDDHLRNHGFLRTSTAGWSLAPAFDVNPDPRGGGRLLSTAIDLDDNRAKLEVLLRVGDYFRVGEELAATMLGPLLDATGRWREVAGANGVRASELAYMAPAFEHEEREFAREWVASRA